jgi:hypothetical protein
MDILYNLDWFLLSLADPNFVSKPDCYLIQKYLLRNSVQKYVFTKQFYHYTIYSDMKVRNNIAMRVYEGPSKSAVTIWQLKLANLSPKHS